MDLAGTHSPSVGDVLNVAMSLRWSRPDLTADLAEHLVEAASTTGDRETWAVATAWVLHGRSASGDGRVRAREVLDVLPEWGGAAVLAAPFGARLRIELATAAHLAQAVDVARALLTPIVDRAPADPAIRADALCGLARCALEDTPAEVPGLLNEAAAIWSRQHDPNAECGAVSVELLRAVAHRRAGRATETVRHAAAGLERLRAVRGPAHLVTRTGHLAAALTVEWITALLDAGRVAEAREACGSVARNLLAPARRGRPYLRLRLAVMRAMAGTGRRAEMLEELRRTANDAMAADIPDLESVCRSTLGELLEKDGRVDEALTELRRGTEAEQRDRTRSGQLRDKLIAAQDLWTPAGAPGTGSALNGRSLPGATHGTARINGSPRRPDGDGPPLRTEPDVPGRRDGWSWSPSSHARDSVAVGSDRERAGWGSTGGSGGRRHAVDSSAMRDGSPASRGTGTSPRGESRPGRGWTDDWPATPKGTDTATGGRHAMSDDFGSTPAPGSWSSGPSTEIRPRHASDNRGLGGPGDQSDPPSDSPIGDLLFRELRADAGRWSHQDRPAGHYDLDNQPGRHATSDPWATGAWPTPESDRADHRTPSQSHDRAMRGTPHSSRPSDDPDSWLASALADLDRIWPSTGGESQSTGTTRDHFAATEHPEPGITGRHGRREHGSPARDIGPVAVIDLAVSGERISGRRANRHIRALADRLSTELPPGAQLRTDQPSAVSIAFPGRSSAAVAEWLHRVVPDLAAVVSTTDNPPGTQLRAAVHDVDGVPGVQIVQRVDGLASTGVAQSTSPVRDADTESPFRGESVPARSGRHRHRDASEPATGSSRYDNTSSDRRSSMDPVRAASSPPPEDMGLGDLLAGALAAYRGI